MAEQNEERRRSVHVRTLFANTGEGFIVLDERARIRVFNETAEALFGKTREDVVGQPIDVLGLPDMTEYVNATWEENEPRRKPCVIETDGRTLSCKSLPFESADGFGRAIIVRDDTELLAQQERAEAILAGASDGLLVFDPDSRLTYMNPSAADMLGRESQEVVGTHIAMNELLGIQAPDAEDVRPCWEILGCGRIDCPAHGAEDLRCWLRCGTLGGDGTPLSYRDKRERCMRCEVYSENAELLGEFGGDAREVEISEPEHRILQLRTNPVVSPSGKYLGCVTSLHDMTAEREIAVMKNEFVSMVSHELRTPLTSIKGYVDLVVDGDAGEINEVQKEFLEIVQENSNRLVSLINDLLDISRIESGRVHLKIEPVDMAEVIQGVVETFRTVSEQSDVGLEWDSPCGLPRAGADRDRIGQVLMNFVSNAIKYSPDGGTVTVSASLREDDVLIEITDTGIGISEEDQKQLFSKFFRVDSTLTREIGGTGLGLSICKSVVELHGGEVGVRSKTGEGSTFWFTLPVASADLVRTPRVEAPVEMGGKVLVVDRDPEVSELIGAFLKKRGYEVIQAHTARDAFDFAVKHQPRAITLDVILEDMDGFDLLQNLKDDERTAAIPIVVLSIVCDKGKSLRLGAAEYLEKPIDQSRLVEIIDSLVGAVSSPVVLVVDDDRDIVSALCNTLRARGFAGIAAYDGREAMAAIESRKPDLVLLDLRMPEMDGYQVIQAVKSRPDTNHIPIVVMTAHRIDRKKIDLLRLTADQITKPLSAESLADYVENMLAGGE